MIICKVFLIMLISAKVFSTNERAHRLEKMELTFTVNGKGFAATPYTNTLSNRSFLKSLLTSPGVFETLRDSKPWADDLLKQKSESYFLDNQKAYEVFSGGLEYDPKIFGICWIIKDSFGKLIGRGGFQPEDSVHPTLSEVYLAILPQYQNQGIGTEFVREITAWFRKNISKGMPLRALALTENKASQKILEKNNYKVQFDKRSHPLKTTAWGMEYLVFLLS